MNATPVTDVQWYLDKADTLGEEYLRDLWRVANGIAKDEDLPGVVRTRAAEERSRIEQAAAQWKAEQNEQAMNRAVQEGERQDDIRAYAAKATRDATLAHTSPAAPPQALRPIGAVEDGMYRHPASHRIYKVQKAVHGSGKLYAKILVVEQEPLRDAEGTITAPAKIRFDYAPGMVRRLDQTWRLTKDQAREFGALYGTCVRCGRTLTREDSIERMMGRTCAGLMGW